MQGIPAAAADIPRDPDGLRQFLAGSGNDGQ
jgi:hypothetical protein